MQRRFWSVFTDWNGARSANGWFSTRSEAEADIEQFFTRASRQHWTAEVREGRPW